MKSTKTGSHEVFNTPKGISKGWILLVGTLLVITIIMIRPQSPESPQSSVEQSATEQITNEQTTADTDSWKVRGQSPPISLIPMGTSAQNSDIPATMPLSRK